MSKHDKLKSTLDQIKNATEIIPKSADVFKVLKIQSSEVVRSSLSQWQSAYEDAKEVDNPDRTELLELYEQIELDTHVTAVTETIYHGISSMDFSVNDKNGKRDEEATKLFKSGWFSTWLALATESIFWGFTGVQFYSVIDDKFEKLKSIPRYNILPEKNGFVINQGDQKIHKSFLEKPYAAWTTLIYPKLFGDQYQLGKFNKIAKWFILKREVMQFWAVYNELFGIPYRTMKTDINDNIRKKNAINAMQTMTAASYSIIHQSDEIEFKMPSGTSGHGTFLDFIEMADKQISKGLVGSTMVLEDGSSKSQGEVHERNTNSFIMGYAKMIANYVNDTLIPKMLLLGFKISKDHSFTWESIEKLGTKEWVDILALISKSWDVPEDFVVEMTGIPVEEKVVQLPSVVEDEEDEEKTGVLNNISNSIQKFYNKLR